MSKTRSAEDPRAASLEPIAMRGKAISILILSGLLAYANSFTKVFHLDDHWITECGAIGSLEEFVSLMPNRAILAATLHLNYHVHGVEVFGYHLVNLTIHVGAALTLFGLVRRTLLVAFWQGRFGVGATWFAFAAALFWMVHPLQTQAVTYVIQRSESLMGLAFLLVIYCTLRSSQSAHPWAWQSVAWGSCVIGAGSKEAMITVLPILIAYDRIFLGSWRDMRRRRGWFYLALAAVWVMPLARIVPAMLQAAPEATAGFGMKSLPPRVYWMTQAWVLLYYLVLCFLPHPQVFRFNGWLPTTEFGAFLPAGMAIGILVALTMWSTIKLPWLGFLGIWFFGILSITSVVPLKDIAFENRLYLPLAAVCVLVVAGGHRGLEWLDGHLRGHSAGAVMAPKSTGPDAVGVVGAALMCLLGGVLLTLAFIRNEDYRSDSRLYASVEKMYPGNVDVLSLIADDHESAERMDQVVEYNRRILEISASDAQAHFRLGVLLCRQDRAAEGVKEQLFCMTETVDKVPSEPVFGLAHGRLNFELAKGHWILGQRQEALDRFKRAVSAQAHRADRHAALALAQGDLGLGRETRSARERALELDRAWPIRARRLGTHCLHRYPHPSNWMHSEALFYLLQAAGVTENPDPMTLSTLAEAYAATGNYPQSLREVEAALPRLEADRRAEFQKQHARVVAFYEAQ